MKRLLGDLIKEAQPGFACGKQSEEGIFQVRMNNIRPDGGWNLAKQRLVPLDAVANLGKYILREGDVLFNSTNSPEQVGKSAYVPNLQNAAVFSNHFLRIRTSSELDPQYLAHFLIEQYSRGVFAAGCRQWVNQATFSTERLFLIEIPLPPLEEQRRIAAILDKASLLRARSSEGAELIECLGVERLEQLVALYETSLASHKLEDLCDSGAPITYGILQPGPDLDDGIPYVRPSEIKDSRIEVCKLRKTSSEIARKYQKSVLRAGDILLTIVGTIGEVAIVPPELEGANITQSSCRIRIDSRSANPVYVYHYLKSKRVRRQIERDRLGVAVERLNLHHVRDMEILLLPREVQERFAAEVISLESVAFSWSALANRTSALSGSLQHSFFGAK
jgi:type I restriction enzyme S subunit